MSVLLNIPFATIVEADHDYLLSLASQIRQPSCTDAQFLALLTEFTWRLARHDVCEELIMRPAFVHYLGSEGVIWAANDRNDHRVLRQQLLSICAALEQEPESKTNAINRSHALALLKPLLSDMAKHMREESGHQIPRFSKMVGHQESVKLGAQYALALTMTPDTEDFVSKTATQSVPKWFPAHITAYVQSDVQTFRRILARMIQQGYDKVRSRRILEQLLSLGLQEFVTRHVDHQEEHHSGSGIKL